MDAKHKAYIEKDFRAVAFHPILPSRVLIKNCGKPAHSLSPIIVKGIRDLCLRQKQKSTHWTGFKRHLLQALEQWQPKFLSLATVWHVLREECIEPFRLQRVQCLKDDGYSHRQHFVSWMLQSITNNPHFLNSVLLLDEVSFTREGIFYTHNEHVWTGRNPQLTASPKHKEKFPVSVWAGIFGDHLMAPYLSRSSDRRKIPCLPGESAA